MCLVIQLQKCEPNHPDLSVTYSHISSAYFRKGDLDKVTSLHMLIVTLRVVVSYMYGSTFIVSIHCLCEGKIREVGNICDCRIFASSLNVLQCICVQSNMFMYAMLVSTY